MNKKIEPDPFELSFGRGDTIRKEHSDGLAIVAKSIASFATEVAIEQKK